MFECQLKSTKLLKNVIDVLTSILEDTVIIWAKPEGLGILAMDPSHVGIFQEEF